MISIIDCDFGNVGSISRMLEKIGSPSSKISSCSEVAEASKIILPGVGHFKHGMESLRQTKLDQSIIAASKSGTPILGICLGMQLLFSHSEEGDCDGLDLIAGHIKKFNGENVKVPHMGWNEIKVKRENPLVRPKNIDQRQDRYYFVHSYHAKCENDADVIATVEHGEEITAIVGSGKTFGTQFHPEKSHSFGMQLLQNFSDL